MSEAKAKAEIKHSDAAEAIQMAHRPATSVPSTVQAQAQVNNPPKLLPYQQRMRQQGTYLIVDEYGNRLPDTGVMAHRIMMLTFNAGEFVRVNPMSIGKVMTVGFKNHEEYCWVCIKHDGPDQWVRVPADKLGRVSQEEVDAQLARGYGG